MRTRISFLLAAAFSAAVATFHLLFALANFGLASEEDAAFSVPLAEGALSLVGAVALAAAAVMLFRRRLCRASVVALAGTSPLPIFFAFTVPKHSGWQFLFGSLVVPAVAGVTAVGTARRRRSSRRPSSAA